MPKIDKAEAHYSVGHQTSHCGHSFEGDKNYCRYYTPRETETGTCSRVQGEIGRIMWCRLFAKVQSR